MAGKFALEKCGNAKFLFNLDEPFFVLKAPNGQIIGKSEMYDSAKGMENGIASVKANAPGAGVVEVTE